MQIRDKHTAQTPQPLQTCNSDGRADNAKLNKFAANVQEYVGTASLDCHEGRSKHFITCCSARRPAASTEMPGTPFVASKRGCGCATAPPPDIFLRRRQGELTQARRLEGGTSASVTRGCCRLQEGEPESNRQRLFPACLESRTVHERR